MDMEFVSILVLLVNKKDLLKNQNLPLLPQTYFGFIFVSEMILFLFESNNKVSKV